MHEAFGEAMEMKTVHLRHSKGLSAADGQTNETKLDSDFDLNSVCGHRLVQVVDVVPPSAPRI